MQTGSDNMAVQEFQDRIWTLEEYKHAVGVSSRTDVIEHPDTAEVLSEMETMVVECPEIAQFYAGALKRYKEGKPETVADELEVISERIALMESEGLFTEKRAAELKEQIKTGAIVKNEAETFFSMFKRVVPAELLPRRERKTRAVRAVRGPNQARSIDMVITEHGGVRINGKFLRALTPVQKLIIFSGLAKGEGFRHFEIYGSDEFAQVAGKGTREEQAEKYTAEWDALQEFLKQNRFSRLVDDKRKPGEKRHIIAAHSVDDQRRVQPQRSTASSSAVRQRRRFYEESDRAEVHSFGRPRSEVNETAFEASLLEQASTMVLDRVLSSSVPVRRNDIIGEVARRFELDPNVARRLVTTIYQRERQSETPRIQQQRLSGGKYFGRPSQHEVADEKVSPYGPYFDGTPAEFAARHGSVKGLRPGFINYERGAIRLDGAERALLEYFERTGIERAVAEKMVIYDLSQRGVIVTKEQIREAVRVVNALYGREFLRSLEPAGRATAAKGPRVQRVGSFMDPQA